MRTAICPLFPPPLPSIKRVQIPAKERLCNMSSVPGFANGWTTTSDEGFSMLPRRRTLFLPVLLFTLITDGTVQSENHTLSPNTATANGRPGSSSNTLHTSYLCHEYFLKDKAWNICTIPTLKQFLTIAAKQGMSHDLQMHQGETTWWGNLVLEREPGDMIP